MQGTNKTEIKTNGRYLQGWKSSSLVLYTLYTLYTRILLMVLPHYGTKLAMMMMLIKVMMMADEIIVISYNLQQQFIF